MLDNFQTTKIWPQKHTHRRQSVLCIYYKWLCILDLTKVNSAAISILATDTEKHECSYDFHQVFPINLNSKIKRIWLSYSRCQGLISILEIDDDDINLTINQFSLCVKQNKPVFRREPLFNFAVQNEMTCDLVWCNIGVQCIIVISLYLIVFSAILTYCMVEVSSN